jgi:hypothetical protein
MNVRLYISDGRGVAELPSLKIYYVRNERRELGWGLFRLQYRLMCQGYRQLRSCNPQLHHAIMAKSREAGILQ